MRLEIFMSYELMIPLKAFLKFAFQTTAMISKVSLCIHSLVFSHEVTMQYVVTNPISKLMEK